MAEKCYSCGIFTTFYTESQNYSEKFFYVVAPTLRDKILVYLFVLWMVYRICQLMLNKSIDEKEFLAQFINFSIASAFLSTFEYWNGFFFWLYEVGLHMGIQLLKIGRSDGSVITGNNLDVFLMKIEDAFSQPFAKIGTYLSDISFTSLGKAVQIIPIAIVYVMLLYRMFSSLFLIFVQFFALSLCAPVLCTLYILPPFRSALFASIRIGLMSMLQLILVCAAIGIITIYLGKYETDKNLNLTVGATDYLETFLVGALLWGAYSAILGIPAQLFNMVAPSGNDFMSSIGRQAAAMTAGGVHYISRVGRSAASAGASTIKQGVTRLRG